MDKDSEKYKLKLREAIDHLFNMGETAKKAAPAPAKSTHNPAPEQNSGGKREYADIKRAFEKLGGPSMVDIMQLIGIEDDDKGINRSLFRKKVKQIQNPDTKSYYQFDDKELAKVRAAIDIK